MMKMVMVEAFRAVTHRRTRGLRLQKVAVIATPRTLLNSCLTEPCNTSECGKAFVGKCVQNRNTFTNYLAGTHVLGQQHGFIMDG